MKFNWSKIDTASREDQVIWLRAWQAQLEVSITRQRNAQRDAPSVRREILLLERDRLLSEMQAVTAAAEAGLPDLAMRLSSLRISIGCQQLLQTDEEDVDGNAMQRRD